MLSQLAAFYALSSYLKTCCERVWARLIPVYPSEAPVDPTWVPVGISQSKQTSHHFFQEHLPNDPGKPSAVNINMDLFIVPHAILLPKPDVKLCDGRITVEKISFDRERLCRKRIRTILNCIKKLAWKQVQTAPCKAAQLSGAPFNSHPFIRKSLKMTV